MGCGMGCCLELCFGEGRFVVGLFWRFLLFVIDFAFRDEVELAIVTQIS